MSQYIVSSSPHIANKRTVSGIMLEVLIALAPAVIASVIFYGFYALFLEILSVGAAVGTEALYNRVMKRDQTVKDCSAMVTGLLLALNIPVSAPFYVPVIGSAFAILFVKMLFGGIGKNFANPAITARIFLLLAWASVMTSFVKPILWSGGAKEIFKYFACIVKGPSGLGDVAAVTSATPLASLREGAEKVKDLPLLAMFLGNTGGSLGETSALAVLLGGVYLIIRRIIDWRVPTVYLATVALFAMIYGAAKGAVGAYILPSLLGGGLMLGAFFMATDYATSPNTKTGLVVYAVGLGLITSLIRFFGNYPEGVSFAILLMNIVTPFIDKFIRPRPFGFVKQGKGGAK
ncbi:MAG: RnfABCDGE type electron transport complex subunit D [Clostridia bacterium]|nr:RnfABCDGE type electron transport complex subunit D [Clostridia bacterium]